MSDPYGWPDYPSLADLAPDMCADRDCRTGNEMPRSRNCYWHATGAERVAIDAHYASAPDYDEQVRAGVDAEDDRRAERYEG